MNRVREFRKALGLSGEVFARKAKIGIATLYYIETGYRFGGGKPRKPRGSTMKRISRVLGRSWQEVFPDYMTSKIPAAPRSEKCPWCGLQADPQTHAALVVGGRIVKEYGHLRCLKEFIRTE